MMVQISKALSLKIKKAYLRSRLSLRNIWTIMSKEVSSFFTTSVGYTVILGYVLTTSLFFLLILDILRSEGSIPPTFRPLTLFYKQKLILFMFIFLCSILSMRLFSHEKETGTIEMLLTVPVTDWEVVIGKYAATVVFYMMCLSPSLLNSVVLFRPEIAQNLFSTLILPSLLFLPLMLIAFSFISSKAKISKVVILLTAAFFVIIMLRGFGLDRITQRVRFIPEDQIDFDNDGMADKWEKKYGLDPTLKNDMEDPDQDGDPNIEEFLYGTDPRDPASNVRALILKTINPKNVKGRGEEDLDGDRIPDKWEKWLGLSSENSEDGLQDNDGDGDPNYLEWQYGTDLKDPKENLKSKYRRQLPVKNRIKNANEDTDNDGMPDNWEKTYNFSVSEDDSGVDEDEDGFSNLEEFHYRTDPLDRTSIPKLSEVKAWFLHILSYVLALGLFMFISYDYEPKKEARSILILKYAGTGGIILTLIFAGLYLALDIQTESANSVFLFWGFILFFLTITAILSSIALQSRSKLNAAAVAVFLFLVFRLFWCFYIAPQAPSPPDVGTTFSGYIGSVLLGGLFLSVGIFFSALFRNQINAAVVTFAFLLIVFLSSLLPYIKPSLQEWQGLFDFYNFSKLTANFTEGNIHLKNIALFVTTIFTFLFLTVKVLGIRKWR